MGILGWCIAWVIQYVDLGRLRRWGCAIGSGPLLAVISLPGLDISWNATSVESWRYTIPATQESVDIALPIFEIDGKPTRMVLRELHEAGAPVVLRNGAKEYSFEGGLEVDASIRLQVQFRAAEDSPVVRFRYVLKSSGAQKLTKNSGKDCLEYLSYSAQAFPEQKEIRLSVFNEMIHSCHLTEAVIHPTDYVHSVSAMGPILLGSSARSTFLCAYEHDSMYGNSFLEYRFQPDNRVVLRGVKGNYYAGQPVQGYSTVWFEAAGVAGDEDALAQQYRRFALRYLSENTGSRTPYIYYNTWGRQEREKWRGGQYLTTMNLDYTVREIAQAHALGVDVYVLDAGWFDRTGDWGVNLKNFPDGFEQVRATLNGYGMQLGVWMNPEKAAVSSRVLKEYPNCLKTRNGKPQTPSPEWETEDSTDMCLVSPYWEAYADTLIRLYTELGIHYFYWDGVGQSGCDDPGHYHGTAENALEERQEGYGFLLPTYLGKIAEKVGQACPEVIFDFDVTESGRIGVGLQFLASGRYFIQNNGPYFHNFDLCPKGESVLANGCRNIFIHPGPARGWFMRSVLDYDRWLPSHLFLGNYQPDDPEDSQRINLGSLVLGQNALWGELLRVSPEGVARFGTVLGRYKQIREDVLLASPVHLGAPGDTPEIYEKVNPQTGKGVVVVFANTKGTFSYVTRHAVSESLWHDAGVDVKMGPDGHAEILAMFEGPSARMVFFGVR